MTCSQEPVFEQRKTLLQLWKEAFFIKKYGTCP